MIEPKCIHYRRGAVWPGLIVLGSAVRRGEEEYARSVQLVV